ncbi:MAG: Ig-like domain-containing protein [Clostridia bacterium]|nr:Ig-like domain-containing protein [Clostridia bacterium]
MREKWSKVILAAFTTTCCAFGAACGVNNPPSSSGKGEDTQTCVLNELAISVNVDESFTLQVLGNDLNLDVVWFTSNANIATVANGTVTGVAPGNVNVKAEVGEQTLSCVVTVSFAYENAVYVTLENEKETAEGFALQLLKGSEYTLSPALIDGEKVENVTFAITSESEAVTVSGLTLTASELVEEAEVEISCQYEGKTYRLIVLVTVAE